MPTFLKKDLFTKIYREKTEKEDLLILINQYFFKQKHLERIKLTIT